MSALVIAGFHRSGTSLTAQLLHRAGLHLGDDLIGVNPSNPYGHFEDRDFVRLHDALLDDGGRTWHVDEPFTPSISLARWNQMASLADRRRVRHRLWGFKDPRSCFFLAAWRYLIPDMRTLIVFRDPRECAFSLERRHASELVRHTGPADLHRLFWERPDHALRMWAVHNEALVDFALSHREDTVVIAHADLGLGLPVVEMLEDRFELGLLPVRTLEVYDPTVTRARQSRQHVARQATVDRILRVWQDLQELADQDKRMYVERHHARS